MTHRLIFACEANICRSPLMEQVLRSRVEADLWEITSVGTRVGPGDRPMCTVSADVARAVGPGDSTVEHRSTAVDVEALHAAELVLTASRAERSAIAQLLPEARSKTFTLREAIHLGAAPLRSEELTAIADLIDDAPTEGLGAYAAALHRRRGFVAPPTAGRTLWGKRRPNALDIPDAHHGGSREHRSMLEGTARDVVELHRQLDAFLTAPVTDPAVR